VGILEEILATQKEILAALSGGTVSKAGTATDKPKGTTGTDYEEGDGSDARNRTRQNPRSRRS
jgi:hypothetical protein